MPGMGKKKDKIEELAKPGLDYIDATRKAFAEGGFGDQDPNRAFGGGMGDTTLLGHAALIAAAIVQPLLKRIEEQAAQIKDLQADLDRHIGRP